MIGPRVWLFVFVLVAAACGGAVYRPSTVARFDIDREVDDADIGAAFDARPQMEPRVRVAVFSFAPAHAEELERRVRTLARVAGTYRIPTLLATGQGRFDEDAPYEPRPEVSLKKLRLLAARARCDLLVVFDYGYRTRTDANALVALNVLLVPSLFVPFLEARAESYLDAYVLDTRNGFLYAHLTADEDEREGSVTIWSAADERMVRRQWKRLAGQTARRIAALLAAEAGRSDPVEVTRR